MSLNNTDASSSRILIADDDPSILLLLKHILLAEGYTVTEAATGSEALELCNNNEYELAIFDFVMPDMSGIDVCKILSHQINDTPPVLIVTSLDDDASVDKAFQSGATDYITKPINWSVFKNRVSRIVKAEQTRKVARRLEHHDPLTGLPNRLLLLDRLESAIYRAKRNNTHVALMMIDIDNFKLINETLGHDKGDLLLQSLSTRLLDAIRETDTLSRIGGDEFSLIIENIERIEDIVQMAEHLSNILEHDITLGNQNIHIKASMGITLYPQDGNDIGTLLRNSDIALHKAKDLGSNLYHFFSPDLSRKAFRRLNLENNLRNAIDNKELVVFYQPKVELTTGKARGMEALVRWQHPEQGLIPPDEFIPIAEETGLIIPLGEYVIETACKQFCQWQNNNIDINNISINVSARQFKEQDLLGLFKKIFSENDIDPSHIELELTESALLNNEYHTESKLNKLHDMGIKISIDDFGTGYASLSYLKRLPIDILKIDRSFTDGVLTDPDDLAIINAITGLATALGLQLVAEGIEDIEQLNKIIDLGIDYGQGFYWSQPCSADQYMELLQRLALNK
ncbi:MAG: EAL domain-containing protein [Gammaproteobacteria bacterium]|nr:EAL domain-containing protein [Gammaproteobacteria bacterium]